jgi:diguanylate cyclase (GGDEF)-like protein/PAS domain S-box-containing protein
MLIRSLRETDLCLEELTSGEVDTVSDRDGQSLLLRRAQDQLRVSEAAKHAAILNALPASIVLLDAQGRIVSTNEAWRRSARANALCNPSYGVGLNYLDVCDSAQGKNVLEARRVADGIRSVLANKVKTFSIEYPCHPPTEQRWCLLTVTPLANDPRKGAVVMHIDITEQKRGEEALRRFEATMDVTADAIFLIDRTTMRCVHVNQAACSMMNRPRAELLALGPAEILATPRFEMERIYDPLIGGGVIGIPVESQWRGVDGSPMWVEVRRRAHHCADRWMIVVMIRNVTERMRAERRIDRLNRLYAVLRGIHTLIVRIRDRDELFRQACRIAVEAGAFKMAWIGVIDPQTLDGKVVACCGAEEDYVQSIILTAREGSPNSERPACRALRLSQSVICNDIATDLSKAPFREDLLPKGLQSVGCFPLTSNGQTGAVLALFADEPDVFDEEEMRLLEELAGDISFALDHIAKAERLYYLAYYDDLTGLANRTLFFERVAQCVHSADGGGHGLAMFLIDLERFRNINCSFGRSAGDILLQQVAQWLTRKVGDVNLVARVDADHFAVVLPHIRQHGDVVHLLEKAIQSLAAQRFFLKEGIFRISARVGVAISPRDGADADTLFKNAEAALQEAKANGAPYLFYSHQMSASVAHNLALENQLRQAVEKREFVLHYQPKVNVISGKLTGAEALIRWNNPRTGLVPPGQFIPILETSGLIHEVGRWALGRAIEDYLRWLKAGLAAVRIAVNISPRQLGHRDFIDEVRQAIGIDRRTAGALELEVTESLVMEDVEHSIACLRSVRAMGVSVAIDDFGTGYSSLSYLSKLPVDALKIDRSFVADMTASPEGRLLVSTIINLAHSLKLKVVAEGVETEQQSHLLRLLKCDELQGYFIGKPVPCDIFESKFLMHPSHA